MFTFPGRRCVVSLLDGSNLRGITKWSWGMLRLRDTGAFAPTGEQLGVADRVDVNPSQVITVQYVGK